MQRANHRHTDKETTTGPTAAQRCARWAFVFIHKWFEPPSPSGAKFDHNFLRLIAPIPISLLGLITIVLIALDT